LAVRFSVRIAVTREANATVGDVPVGNPEPPMDGRRWGASRAKPGAFATGGGLSARRCIGVVRDDPSAP